MEKIKEWLGQGLSMGEIAKNIGVSRTTLYKHITDTDSADNGADSLDTIRKYRQPAVDKLESIMFMTACGFEKVIKKYVKVKHCLYENGKKADEWEELQEYDEVIYFPPNANAGMFLLKNWGNYVNEPKVVEIRQKELELKEKQVNNQIWGVEDDS